MKITPYSVSQFLREVADQIDSGILSVDAFGMDNIFDPKGHLDGLLLEAKFTCNSYEDDEDDEKEEAAEELNAAWERSQGTLRNRVSTSSPNFVRTSERTGLTRPSL
jgi:hypothetical protein